MTSFLTGSVLALLLAAAAIWGYAEYPLSEPEAFGTAAVHVDQQDDPRARQGPPPIEPR